MPHPTEERVWAAFLYHAGLSYRTVGEALGHSHEAVHQWYHQLAELFAPEPDRRGRITVDETKVHVETSPGRSALDALYFLETVLERCRGDPVILADRGPWYD